ncbi:MAG: hypothetical protein ACKOCU_14865 [Betaproteobacteria bacterium]
MDHPILSVHEFADLFRRKAQDLGYDNCELIDLSPHQSRHWFCVRAAFGFVIRGQAIIGTHLQRLTCSAAEEFELSNAEGLCIVSGSEGARVFIARLGRLNNPLIYGASARMVDHAWG